ncbi:hypothetical protein OIO90_003114 [Microbotryomycetes sp. JL221]|nr:hypothetical protein OIO90_003114 [Microbotryomycetes sp. JL221]
MDQSAFRAILESTSNTSSRTGPKQRLGAAPSKRAPATTTLPTASGSATEFKPRKTTKSQDKDASNTKSKTSTLPHGYRDRAAERRAGKESDFTQAEKLLEDFKARADDQGVDEETFKEQMKYLGGDAEHSILVKGLDMALLERERAKQADESDQTLEQVEDELDKALLDKASQRTKKRTRDDMIAELRKRAAGANDDSKSEHEPESSKTKSASGFKPIGWKAVEGAEPGKKKKRKKNKPIAPLQQPEQPQDDATGASATAVPSGPKLAQPLTQPTIDVEDDDFDIFGDAGEYKGLDTDSEDEENEKPRPDQHESEASASLTNKVKYFDDDDEEGPETTAPSTVAQLASKQSEADAAAIASANDNDGEDRPLKLQPLSKSAIPSVRELLDMDDAAEKEEKRISRKAHFQMKAAERKQAALDKMTPEQKAEHEHQVMMAYLDKKERKTHGGRADEDEDAGPGW